MAPVVRPGTIAVASPIVMMFEGHTVTMLTDDQGDLWWFADEVCAALGLSHKQAVSRLDEDEKGVRITDTPGGPQHKAIINESGLYSLILRSRKPEAKRFRRWVTHEVLPSIRKTGHYVAPRSPLADRSPIATRSIFRRSAVGTRLRGEDTHRRWHRGHAHVSQRWPRSVPPCGGWT